MPASAPAHCAIYHQVGDCIMPREGVFCRVIEGGAIAPSTTTPIGSCALRATPPGSTSTSWRAFPNGPPTYSTRTPPCTDAPISSMRDCRSTSTSCSSSSAKPRSAGDAISPSRRAGPEASPPARGCPRRCGRK
ncbi:hypothetical protein F8D48_04955 [Adlercreutzia muris]|uniref:Uncharacterized protein n=1 Tax=Adlercreutzia muris TaxID=1796610 RepID=A0A7C8FX15_9ACTN|nr:hypothetical protein F8D48_04955 [Adlercreutzia muris]